MRSTLPKESFTSNILWSLQIVGNNFRWRINEFWCSAPVQYNITKLLYYYSNFQQQEPNFKLQKNHDNLINQGRYLLIQICKICYGWDDSLLGNLSATPCSFSFFFVTIMEISNLNQEWFLPFSRIWLNKRNILIKRLFKA